MSCTYAEKDQMFVVQDFGPGGIRAPVYLDMPHGLKPGGVISAVITTDEDMAINVRDVSNNILIHVVARVTRNDFALNSFLDGSWGPEQKVSPIPTVRGCRFIATLVYETSGYRVFVNGAEVAFYQHRSGAEVRKAEVNGGEVFKFSYLTMKGVK